MSEEQIEQTMTELERVAERLQQAVQRVEQARQERTEAIKAAYRAGVMLGRLDEALSLSRRTIAYATQASKEKPSRAEWDEAEAEAKLQEAITVREREEQAEAEYERVLAERDALLLSLPTARKLNLKRLEEITGLGTAGFERARTRARKARVRA